MPLKLTTIPTPKTLKFSDEDKRTLHDIGSLLTSEMNDYSRWTNGCSSIMRSNPRLLFQYDRFEYVLGNAYGSHDIKIVLNPIMLICPHPDCLKVNPLIRIYHPFNLKNYLKHLVRHQDRMGDAMRKRFRAVSANLFLTPASLDAISISPHHLQTVKEGNKQTAEIMENYGIERGLNVNYVCHWKDKLLGCGIINCESLTFQEDEALITSVLTYPNPVKDWTLWNTLYLYGLKFLSSVSSTGLNLYRGITSYPRLNDTSCSNVAEFTSNINHPTASLTSFQNDLPDLDYSNKVYQGGEILYHIKRLQKSDDSLGLDYSANNVLRYPITLGIDEQELNPGTFIHDGLLHGLDRKMTAEEINEIGLNKLSNYIAENNNFVTGVREYRATDFRDTVCSNVLTEFVTHELTGDQCIKRLKECIVFANSCHRCLVDNIECKYDRIDEQCSHCFEQKFRCVSLVAIHVLWDMGSGHKKADLGWYHLSEDSPESEMFSSLMVTIGFGGLHLGKSFVCTSRNYVLSHNGEDFGVNILMEMKQSCEILQGINNSVFICRDKQSDVLNYTIVGEKVQHSLKSNSKYLITRVPEKYLTYKENAKTQERIIMPKAVCSNRNGDVFLLDSGASCIHVIDRSTVAKVYIVGTHGISQLSPYKPTFDNSVSNIRLGCDLLDMHIDYDNDDIAVHDASREEVIIIQGCVTAKTVLSRKFYIFKAEGVRSILLNSDLYVLRQSDDDYVIQIVSLNLPKKNAKKKENIYLDHKILGTIVLSASIDIVSLFYVPKQNMIGLFNINKSSYIMLIESEKVKSVMEMNMTSDVRPYISTDDKILFWSGNRLSLYQLSVQKTSVSLTLLDELQLDGHFQAFSIHGNVVSIAIALNESRCTNQYSVLQWGSLDFGLSYCEAVSKLYSAIGYVPPGGTRRQISLDECIVEAEYCCLLLQNMQQERKDMFSSRESFMGCDGIPWSKTIECLVRTIKSWKVLCARMEILKPGSSRQITSHSIANESYVEHSFGFTKKKGQGHNQSQEEYIQAKRTHMVDFQMRMCKLPFCQHTKTKLRDKGYQSLESRQVPMSLNEFQEIFHYSKSSKPEQRVIDDDNEQLLKKANLLCRYVPRQSSRSRWRATSGQIPSMIVVRSCSCLFLDDLIFHRSLDGGLKGLVVKKMLLLSNKDSKVHVWSVAEKKELDIVVEKLVCHKQQILTVPSALYDIVDGKVSFTDEFSPIFESILDNIEGGDTEFSEEDWSILLSGEVVNHADEDAEEITEEDEEQEGNEADDQIEDLVIQRTSSKRKAASLKNVERKKQMKQQCISSDEDNDDADVATGYLELVHKVGDWVVVQYDDLPYIGIVKEVDVHLGFKVHTMDSGKGNSFTWSSDCIWYKKKKVLTNVEALKPSNNRGALKLSDADFTKFKSL